MRLRRPLAVATLFALGACSRTGEVLRPGDGGAPVVLHLSDVRLSAGQSHACAVAGGALVCWGDDGDGRLGVAANGAGTGQGPVAVSGGGSWVAPAAGGSHSCGLAADGRVWCWGGNAVGQLGAGDLVPSNDPRPVALPERAVDLRTGFDHTCALLADASLWCWGYNLEGQLGLGDQYPGPSYPAPVQVGTDRDWVFVAAGQGHSCGIRSPGALYCWGRNTDYQLGQGTADPQEIRAPVRVGTDADWVEVSCGQATTCARKRDGSAYCWGSMDSGTLAVGDLAPRPAPARIPLLSDWLGVATNTFHTCGLRVAGTILVRRARHRGADWHAGFGGRAARHAAGRPERRLGRGAGRPLLHLRAPGRRHNLVHGHQHRPRARRRRVPRPQRRPAAGPLRAGRGGRGHAFKNGRKSLAIWK